MCSANITKNGIGSNCKASEEVDQALHQAEVHHVYDDFVIRTKSSNEWLLTYFMQPNNKASSNNTKIIQDRISRMRYHVIVGNEANQIMIEPNAGGASVVSEAVSMELMHRRFGATDVATEMAIQYWCVNWKKIDYIATIHGSRTGVSVTRAMGYPDASTFTEEDADRLCYKKLFGLVVARAGISRAFSYERSILHVFCQDDRIAELMKVAFKKLIQLDEQQHDAETSLTGSIIIILTVCCNFSEVFTDDGSCIQNIL
jgi:hypothetical protein